MPHETKHEQSLSYLVVEQASPGCSGDYILDIAIWNTNLKTDRLAPMTYHFLLRRFFRAALDLWARVRPDGKDGRSPFFVRKNIKFIPAS